MKEAIEQMTFSGAKEKYSLDFLDDYIDEIYQDKLITVFHDDMTFDYFDIDQDYFSNQLGGCIFLKNLTVNHSLVQSELNFGPLFIVFGDITAKSIFIGGSESYFRGNVTAEDIFIAGVYNHGMLNVEGEIKTKVLYSYDHAFIYDENKVSANSIIINQEGSNSLEDAFLDEYIDDDLLDEDKVVNALKLGKSVIKEGAILTKREKLFLQAEQTGFTKLDLDNLKLTELPDFIGHHSTWTEIKLDRNNNPKLPEYFSNFKSLKNLSLYYCDYEEIPQVVTEIVSLQELDLSNNYISDLPDEFMKLNNLQALYLNNCQFSQRPNALTELSIRTLNLASQEVDEFVMDSIESVVHLNLKGNRGLQLQGIFPNLETLDISACQLIEFPKTLFKSQKLKKLCIESNSMLNSFMPEMGLLTELEELQFSRNMGGLIHLAPLKNLKKITISGFDATHEFIESLLALEAWEDIELAELISKDYLFRILERPNLQRLYIRSYEEIPVSKLREQMANLKAKDKM